MRIFPEWKNDHDNSKNKKNNSTPAVSFQCIEIFIGKTVSKKKNSKNGEENANNKTQV